MKNFLFIPLLCFLMAVPAANAKKKIIYVTASETKADSTATTRLPRFKESESIAAFKAWAISQIEYPQTLIRERIGGRVVASFTVRADGKLRNFEILESPHQLLSDEVRRVVLASGRHWEPGLNEGVFSDCQVTVPFDFDLHSSKSKAERRIEAETPREPEKTYDPYVFL